MRFALAILLSVALALGGIGGAAAKSDKNTKSAKSTKGTKSNSGGPLNGGMYSSGPNSSNKGGSYKDPSTGNQYGQRK